MDPKTARPRSRGQGSSRSPQPAQVPAKVFNCIVDETSLIQGAKKSTRDGIPKWIAAGRMRLFVPLYALGQASRVKATKGRAATDAGEALEWLDEATSEFPDLVILQGGYDKFETWSEVEKFALPSALFSEEDHSEDAEQLEDFDQLHLGEDAGQNGHADLGRSMSSNNSTTGKSTIPSDQSIRSASPLSPPVTPPKASAARGALSTSSARASPQQSAKHRSKQSSCVPRGLQPLFNYILWRVHQETNPAAALDSFIFLSDSAAMRKHAQKFGIRSKTLQEIRYVIARESQDERNRQFVNRKTQGQTPPAAPKVSNSENTVHSVPAEEMGGSVSDDEEEIVLKRAPKAPAAMTNGSHPRTTNLMDPNQFRRDTTKAAPQQRGSPRGSPRGSRGRGNRGRGSTTLQRPVEPIDPDSFSRPSSSRGNARGAKGLWMPT